MVLAQVEPGSLSGLSGPGNLWVLHSLLLGTQGQVWLPWSLWGRGQLGGKDIGLPLRKSMWSGVHGTDRYGVTWYHSTGAETWLRKTVRTWWVFLKIVKSSR